ncbi:MAG: immunoglobulin-like domain-containing protein [Balneolaceae bacterium]|nr:immunoglobulin-like domain-containing protein [Balneolaceae bacterium]
MKAIIPKSVFLFSLSLLLTFSIVSCKVLSGNDSPQITISLSNQSLSAEDTISYSVVNNNDESVFLYINGSVTNIEKKTSNGWVRLENTFPHHPTVIRHEIEPGNKFESIITYELIEGLTEETTGEYRVACNYNKDKSDSKYDIVASKTFTVQ